METSIKAYAKINPEECNITELVYLPVLQELMKEHKGDTEALKEAIKQNARKLE